MSLFPSHTEIAMVQGRRGKRRQKGANEPPGWFPITVGSILLSLDVSVINCGWAVLRKTKTGCKRLASGSFKPKPVGDLTRCNVLFDSVVEVCRIYNVTDAVLEHPNKGPAWRMSADDVRAQMRAFGACEAACHSCGVTVNSIRVREWKGSLGKTETSAWVWGLIRYKSDLSRSDAHNEMDALALGIWLCNRRPIPA